MLIDTGELDWNKPIAYLDLTTGKAFKAVLVSTNYHSTYEAYHYLVVIYGAGKGDKDNVLGYTKDGKSTVTSSTRTIYNTPDKLDQPDSKPADLEETVAKHIKDLGEF